MWDHDQDAVRQALREEIARNGKNAHGGGSSHSHGHTGNRRLPDRETQKRLKAQSKAGKETTAERMKRELRAALDAGDDQAAYRVIRRLGAKKVRDEQRILELNREMRLMIRQEHRDEDYRSCLKALFDMRTVTEFESLDFGDVYRMRFPVMQPASLRQQHVRRRRMKQIGQVPDRWLTNSKRKGEEFAQMVGVKVPHTEYGYTLDELPRRTDVVIKPLVGGGSHGIYVVMAEDDIWSVEEHTHFRSWDAMAENIRKELASGKIGADLFEIQQAIYGDNETKSGAHDLKFYSFYGEIPAVYEVVRTPEKAYWWWTADGELIDIGKTWPEHLKPQGFTPEMMETARQLSLKIPSPYMRLDFLRSGDEMYFDEFCTFSGGTGVLVVEQHFPKWDRLFGNAYLRAEMRIVNDLLAGKTFDEINEFNRRCDAELEALRAEPAADEPDEDDLTEDIPLPDRCDALAADEPDGPDEDEPLDTL